MSLEWAEHAKRRAVDLRARARVAEEEGRSPQWYWERARGVERALDERVAQCGDEEVRVTCGCGTRSVKTKCGVPWVCNACRQALYVPIGERLRTCLRSHRAEEHRLWKGLSAGERRRREARVRDIVTGYTAPTVVGVERWYQMLTLTVRHSGVPSRDRANVEQGWRKLRMWLHRQLTDAGERGKFHYALVWEATRGVKGDGHVHAHVVALLPFVPWGDINDEWKLAVDDEEAHVQISRERYSDTDAAHYVAKYATKGVNLQVMTPKLGADILDAAYAKRRVSTSRGFWAPAPKACGCARCGEDIVREGQMHPLERERLELRALEVEKRRVAQELDEKNRRMPTEQQDLPLLGKIDSGAHVFG